LPSSRCYTTLTADDNGARRALAAAAAEAPKSIRGQSTQWRADKPSFSLRARRPARSTDAYALPLCSLDAEPSVQSTEPKTVALPLPWQDNL
jgi:hypothetical protein